MSTRRNFTLDEDTVAVLDENASDNHSKIVRELLQAYYTPGVYDAEEAAVRVRERELRRQESQLEDELATVREQREQLDALVDDSVESDIEAIAGELSINPEMVGPENPAIRRTAKEHGVDPAVLAEVVEEQAVERRRSELASVEG